MIATKSYLSQSHFGDNATSADLRAHISAGLAVIAAPIQGGSELIVQTLAPTLTAMKVWVDGLPSDIRIVTKSIVFAVVADASRAWMAAALHGSEADVVLKVFKDLFGVIAVCI